ncbi:MAG: hypothetical protein Q4G58_11000 [bacterium]|nr:hypothetical protein [bacterium]
MVFNSQKDLNLYFEKNGFSKKRCEIYLNAYKAGINIYPYLNTEIRTGRLREILVGLKQGVDVSIYNDYTAFRQGQMKQIRFGLLHGLDVSIYAKPEFDDMQMETIRLGMESGLDVSIYADPRIKSPQMIQFYYRMLSQQDREVVTMKNPNASRFNLEEFKFQRVDFEGVITECKISSPYKFGLLIKNLFWQDNYICDHIWIGEAKADAWKFKMETKFDFGDMISFSAEIEPYLHNKDGKIHYGLRDLKNVQIINKEEYVNNYPLNHILRFYLRNLKQYHPDTQEICEGYEAFKCAYKVESDKLMELMFIGYRRDALLFEIRIDGEKLSQVHAEYNPYRGKGKILINDFFFELTDLKSRKERKLMNTFFQAKYLHMFPMIRDEEYVNS